MRSKPRKNKAARLSYKNNWKTYSTAKTRRRTPLPFLQLSFALRSPFETGPPTATLRRQRSPGFFFLPCCCCWPLGCGRFPPPPCCPPIFFCCCCCPPI